MHLSPASKAIHTFFLMLIVVTITLAITSFSLSSAHPHMFHNISIAVMKLQKGFCIFIIVIIASYRVIQIDGVVEVKYSLDSSKCNG